MPEPTGPPLSLDELLVVVHTDRDTYNHRGRLSRCVHMHQRAFHEGLFRKGSSHRGTTSSRCVEVPEVVLNPLFTPHEFFVDGEASLGEHVFIKIGRHG